LFDGSAIVPERVGCGGPVGGWVELSGSDVPTVLLLQFLAEVGSTGRADLWDEHAVGIVYFEDGQAVGAIFGSESGLPALEAIVLVLPRAQFNFSGRPRPSVRNLPMETVAVLSHLRDFADECRRLSFPPQDAVPRPLAQANEMLTGELQANDDLARVLRAVDGRRTVAELSRELGIALTLKSLALLEETQLISLEPRPAPSASAPFLHRLRDALSRVHAADS
jgi:hypothetical protein